ncbi:16342_t:CDS:2 [Funneliformis caledonium]|uniref:16342_t:CDS:1 n=1 Tax=Funneliformis caledonium TaxID=1117310 RepID=A0A9N9DJ21_9GLOM|nr:16342_t:CDS:2 [Funneliformis caledonium]
MKREIITRSNEALAVGTQYSAVYKSSLFHLVFYKGQQHYFWDFPKADLTSSHLPSRMVNDKRLIMIDIESSTERQNKSQYYQCYLVVIGTLGKLEFVESKRRKVMTSTALDKRSQRGNFVRQHKGLHRSSIC